MPTNTNGKVAYVYKDGTWYAISGAINTNASYTWTASQTFSSPVTFEEVLTSKAGVNNFQSPETRDLALTSPIEGLICFVRQVTTGGTAINQLQYYSNGNWKYINGYSTINSKLGDYTVTASDAGKVITVDSSSTSLITLPSNSTEALDVGFKLEVIRLGSGDVQVVGYSGVVVRSKDPLTFTAIPGEPLSGTAIDEQYGKVTILKIDTNT